MSKRGFALVRSSAPTSGLSGQTGSASDKASSLPRPIPMIYDQDSYPFADVDPKTLKRSSGRSSSLPLWVTGDGRIYFEVTALARRSGQALRGSQTELVKAISEFLVAIAEPVCRPEHVHEYQITVCSLYAAIALGMAATEVVDTLERLSKNTLDVALKQYILEHGSRIGKVRLVLRRRRFFVESQDLDLLRTLENSSEKIRAARISAIAMAVAAPAVAAPAGAAGGEVALHSFEVMGSKIESLKESAYHDLNIPLLEEYEFRESLVSSVVAAAAGAGAGALPGYVASAEPQLAIALRPSTQIRPYQEASLHKMFSGNRARSGMIVLPCGAGKTLVGILATSTLKKRTMVLTTTAVAVDQWKRQFELFCQVDPEDVIVLTAESKQSLPDEDKACILISTYSMFAVGRERMSRSSRAVLEQVESVEWGLLVVDEVQVMPAKTFRTVATTVRAHCKLGLTATLVREDDLIEDLQYLIGPKLFEANWQELQDAGYIAKVQCVEVWASMPAQFWTAYLHSKNHHVQRALYTCNPRKLTACEYLIKLHESRQDKIIVFCDNITLLQHMARALKKPFICGSVTMQERMACIRAFQHSNRINTIFLSAVGDNAIDIPNANVVIQISSHYGSRRQEAQRLGRILRPKAYRDSQGFNAYFYSLVSRDTPEKAYAERRQTFLVDQGYSFKIIADFDDRIDARIAEGEKFEYMKEDVQRLLLSRCIEGSALQLESEENLSIIDSSVRISDVEQRVFLEKYTSETADLSELTGGAGGGFYSSAF